MGITIDRDQNIIVNMGGIAHFTRWLAVGYHSMHNHVRLVPGFGYFHNATHWYKEEGQCVWDGTRRELTLELFLDKTNWRPRNE